MKNDRPLVLPLPKKTRTRFFLLLVTIFIVSIPFLFLYAKGYRFHLTEPTNFYGTGGLYIAVERAGAEIYIDDELVRETRVFRKAFYAQNIEPGTHRVHVQAEGYHTWVKELPVSKHLVTEAQAFNLPLVPQVRVVAPWQTATGTMVVRTELPIASTTNEVVATTTKMNTQFVQNTEYLTLKEYFVPATSSPTSTQSAAVRGRIDATLQLTGATSTEEVATTTKETGGVRLYEYDGEVYARWIGSFESMPYYYCAEDFPPYSTSSLEVIPQAGALRTSQAGVEDGGSEQLIHPVQTVSKDTACEPVIRIDRKGQVYSDFDFFPGSSDLVVIGLKDGIYAVEIDDRGWQNMQPLIFGEDLTLIIENGAIYVYDGTLIYQLIVPS